MRKKETYCIISQCDFEKPLYCSECESSSYAQRHMVHIEDSDIGQNMFCSLCLGKMMAELAAKYNGEKLN